MDGSLINAGNGMTAAVVRQFMPSRIEHQLLPQVFEVVCGERSELEQSRWAVKSETSTQRVSKLGPIIRRQPVSVI